MIFELHVSEWSPNVDPNQDLASQKHLKFKKNSWKLQKQLNSLCVLWDRSSLAQFHMETRWVGKTIEFKYKGG